MSYQTMRAQHTRAAIMAAAERLFAERGIAAVSNRQISDAAGQGNTAAVTYHFGTRTEMIRAIVREHAATMDEIRRHMLATIAGSTELRDWIACTVRPITDHLARLDTPSWYARFNAQLMTDPVLRTVLIDEVFDSPALQQAVDGVNRCLPDLPARIHIQRNALVRTLLVHACAERERDLAAGTGPDWAETATLLIDAVTGLLVAPVTT